MDIQSFRSATRDINFDVYLKLSEDNVAHVFSRTTGLDYRRLANYIGKGVRELMIRPEDAAAYQAFIARPARAVFMDPTTPQDRKIATLLNMTEQNLAELFTQMRVSEEAAESSKKVIASYVDLMVSSPQTLTTILKLVSHGEYLYYHSIAVAIFSMFIARSSGRFNRKMLELVGLGGFLHDIGCTQVDRSILDSPNELSADEWEKMHDHPRLGLRMVERTPTIPDEVRHIIYQHHEEPEGRGYPNGLKDSAIYLPARIVSLADAFSALISNRPFRKAYSVEEALRILNSGSGNHDRELVQILSGGFLRGSGAGLPARGRVA